MITTSTIGIEMGNGTVKYIDCHYDGYISHSGRLLIEHYSTEEQVEKLIALGDIFVLKEKLEPDPSTEHSFDNWQEDVCLAYHRDRGENLRQLNIASCYYNIQSMRHAHWADYVYLWKDSEWLYQEIRFLNGEMLYSDWKSLQEAVENLN